jgi:hypothetical protein
VQGDAPVCNTWILIGQLFDGDEAFTVDVPQGMCYGDPEVKPEDRKWDSGSDCGQNISDTEELKRAGDFPVSIKKVIEKLLLKQLISALHTWQHHAQ